MNDLAMEFGKAAGAPPEIWAEFEESLKADVEAWAEAVAQHAKQSTIGEEEFEKGVGPTVSSVHVPRPVGEEEKPRRKQVLSDLEWEVTKFNPCHVPSGPAGGQFCATGGGAHGGVLSAEIEGDPSLPANPFYEGGLTHYVYNLLSDGQPHSYAEVAASVNNSQHFLAGESEESAKNLIHNLMGKFPKAESQGISFKSVNGMAVMEWPGKKQPSGPPKASQPAPANPFLSPGNQKSYNILSDGKPHLASELGAGFTAAGVVNHMSKLTGSSQKGLEFKIVDGNKVVMSWPGKGAGTPAAGKPATAPSAPKASGNPYKAGTAKAALHDWLSDEKLHHEYEIAGVLAKAGSDAKFPKAILFHMKEDGSKATLAGKDGWSIVKTGSFYKMVKAPAIGGTPPSSATAPKAPTIPKPQPPPTQLTGTKPTPAGQHPNLTNLATNFGIGNAKAKVATLLADGKQHTVQECLDAIGSNSPHYPKKIIWQIAAEGKATGAWTINLTGMKPSSSIRARPGVPASSPTAAPSAPKTAAPWKPKPPTASAPESEYDYKNLASSHLSNGASSVWAKMDTSAKASWMSYTGGGYGSINSVLRSGKYDPTMSGGLSTKIKDLDIAVKQWKVPAPTVVYRGASWPMGPVGSVVEDKGFISTSISKSHAFSGNPWKILIPAGANALPINGHSHFKSEQELLLPRGSRFIRVGEKTLKLLLPGQEG